MDSEQTILYEGKAKIVFLHSDPKFVVQHFKDTITAFNAEKVAILEGKGKLNNNISYLLMQYLKEHNIDTHLVKLLNEREQLVKKLSIIPMEVVVRNFAAGSFCKKFGIQKGTIISPPVVEFYYKDDALSDPMMTEDHIISFSIGTAEELLYIKSLALRINTAMGELFNKIDIQLLDFKLEFGRDGEKVILADEISPDTCRLISKSSGEILDKDIYRLELGDPLEGYKEVLRRLKRHFPNALPQVPE